MTQDSDLDRCTQRVMALAARVEWLTQHMESLSPGEANLIAKRAYLAWRIGTVGAALAEAIEAAEFLLAVA